LEIPGGGGGGGTFFHLEIPGKGVKNQFLGDVISKWLGRERVKIMHFQGAVFKNSSEIPSDPHEKPCF
jgi:hypothetical protein